MLTEETKIEILRTIYSSVSTEYKSECHCDFYAHDWVGYQNCVRGLSLCKDTKITENVIETLLDLPNLKKLDLSNYDCEAQLNYQQYQKLKEHGVEILLNKNLIYKDPDVQNQNINIQIAAIKEERDFYQHRVELCDSAISDLESKLVKTCND